MPFFTYTIDEGVYKAVSSMSNSYESAKIIIENTTTNDNEEYILSLEQFKAWELIDALASDNGYSGVEYSGLPYPVPCVPDTYDMILELYHEIE